ncbi:MAG: HAMP domain-containing histidine kinase [Bacteroidia bacterium]|nr:HAMP domain-containing histidine kinase [Bacteroidia bacterium]
MRIFSPLEKTEADPNGSGSGLGLYIAREATLKLGGVISVNSVVGKGSTFKINLPVFLT